MKTFRKSSLISSVALLLVAIVALSGATFAWFAANTSATATGISIKSGSASGLLVSKDGTNFDSSVVFATEAASLEPTSTSDFNTWYTATATSAASYVAASYADDGAVDVNYKHYTLYAKTADGSNQNLKISATTLTDEGDYARIAILQGSTVKVFYMNTDTDEIFPIDNGAVGTAYPATPVSSITDIDLGQINGTATQFDIYVWNEGQDIDCKSLNAAKSAAVDFTLSISPVAAG